MGPKSEKVSRRLDDDGSNERTRTKAPVHVAYHESLFEEASTGDFPELEAPELLKSIQDTIARLDGPERSFITPIKGTTCQHWGLSDHCRTSASEPGWYWHWRTNQLSQSQSLSSSFKMGRCHEGRTCFPRRKWDLNPNSSTPSSPRSWWKVGL